MEQPMIVPSLGGRKTHTPRYVDLLAERRGGSDLRWAVREWRARGHYRHAQELTRDQLFAKVLGSERVKIKIAQLVKSGHEEDELVSEVKGILEQMGHTQDIATIRKFAFVLPKIMKQIYGKILINEDGIEKLRSTLVDTPVVLLPTHRSYADFLLISYIAYHFDLSLPVIAAGMDFMSMAVIGEMLRSSGAFYIRRSFMDSPLYWAVFQEYVQSIVECTGSPLEFFLEGTRSRSGKSLPPKIGLLGCVSESWLRGRLPDIALVPVSIAYDRTLEEKLYAYELLGVPKPKESTSGLLKAMSILKESYGNIVVHVGEPVSTRAFLGPRTDRYLSVGAPPHEAPLNKKELSSCEALGLHVLRQTQSNSLVSVFSLVCLHLARVVVAGGWRTPLLALLEEVSWLADVVGKMGGQVACDGDIGEGVLASLEVHRDLASLDSSGEVTIQRVHQPTTADDDNAGLSGMMDRGVVQVMIQHYVNHCIHLFIRPALVAHALLARTLPSPVQDLQERFVYLRSLFSQDFIFEKDNAGKDFMEGLSVLTWSGEVSFVQGCVHHLGRGDRLVGLLHHLLQPFTTAYRTAAQTLLSEDCIENGSLAHKIQERMGPVVSRSGVYAALSLDTIRHALRSFTKLNHVTRTKGADGQVVLSAVPDKLQFAISALAPSENAVKSKL